MKPELVFNVRNQSISRVDAFHPVQNSRNYLYAQFNFLTRDWEESGTKTALFKGNGMESIAVIIGEDGKCLVPWEVLEKDSFTVSVFAGDLITVDTAIVKVYPSGYESGRDVKDPTPSVYEQIIDSFDDVKKYTTDQAKISTDSANFAKQSKESAEMAKESAETAAKSAEKSANEARDVKDSALKEISQSKSDSLESIESTGNSGVQAVNTAKSDAMTDIANSSNTYLQSISSSGQSAVSGITSAGEDQTKSVNDAGKSQMDTIAALGDSQVKAVNTAGETQLSSIQTASAAAQTAIGTAKEESVSAVRTEGETQVENIRQSAADYESLAIKETVQGESILIEDSAKWPLKGLKLFGKSTQDGTPSPENPVPIVSAGDSGQITISITGDGAESQSIIYPTPNGLPGIPVSSGGNYTDESGQQWVCDEVDFGRGVYVRNIETVVLDGTESWSKRGITKADSYQTNCDEFDYKNADYIVPAISNIYPYNPLINIHSFYVMGHGYISVAFASHGTSTIDQLKELLSETNMVVYGKRSVPEETPLTPDILSAYAALHTNYPTTTVLNDSGAGMEVEYVADTQNYINKLLGSIGQSVNVVADDTGDRAEDVLEDEVGNETGDGLFGEE